MSSQLIQHLEARLRSSAPLEVKDAARARAAVALILAGRDDEVQALFIRRAKREGDPWSGQMALPGGRHGGEDETLLDTAMRETREEVGLDLASAHLLGQLDDVAPLTAVLPPISVRPFAFHLPSVPSLVESSEVAAAVWIPLSILRAPATLGETTVRVCATERTYPAYIIGDAVIWGMTERILTPFLDLVFIP